MPVAGLNPAVEIEGFLLESSLLIGGGLIAAGGTAEADFHRQVEQQRQVWRQMVRSQGVEFDNQAALKTTAAPLIGQGGIGVTVTQNDHSRLQSRAHDFVNMLGPSGGVEQQFGPGYQGLALRGQQNGSNLVSNRTTAGLAGGQHRPLGGSQPVGQQPQLGGFAAAFDPFQGNEKTHHPTHG